MTDFKDSGADDADNTELSIEELEQAAEEAQRRLRRAREKQQEKRGIGQLRENVKDGREAFTKYVERIESYDADMKTRLFGMGAFDGSLDGSLVWVLVGAIYAVEKDPNEKFTTLKTADGPLGVKQSPDEVFNELFRVRFAYREDGLRDAEAELKRREDEFEKAPADAVVVTPVDNPDFDPTNLENPPTPSWPVFSTTTDLEDDDDDDDDDDRDPIQD